MAGENDVAFPEPHFALLVQREGSVVDQREAARLRAGQSLEHKIGRSGAGRGGGGEGKGRFGFGGGWFAQVENSFQMLHIHRRLHAGLHPLHHAIERVLLFRSDERLQLPLAVFAREQHFHLVRHRLVLDDLVREPVAKAFHRVLVHLARNILVQPGVAVLVRGDHGQPLARQSVEQINRVLTFAAVATAAREAHEQAVLVARDDVAAGLVQLGLGFEDELDVPMRQRAEA